VKTLLHISPLLLLFPISIRAEISDPDTTITKICFGSCYKSERNHQIWDRIAEQKPQLFLFMGDNVYGDTDNMKKLQADYDKLNSIAEYKTLKKNTKVLAIWDDHDYGYNDNGREYPKKKESRDIMFNQAYTFGKTGKKLQTILLDTRYFRSELKQKTKSTSPH